MDTVPSSSFYYLYPDVEPTQGLPLTHSERIGIAVAVAVAVFGAVSADYVVAGVGFVLALFATIAPTRKTPRRIRMEARERFPDMDWVEDAQEHKTRILFIAFWAIIAGSCIALSAIPATSGNTTIAGIAAGVSAVVLWFLPGTSKIWNR